MTKRDSSLAGITSPRAPMSMPRRHSSLHGQSGNVATSSGSRPQPSSITDTQPWLSFPGTDPSGSSSHSGYTTVAQSVPMPDSHAHQNPVQPLREEAYPLQTEIEQQHRTLHTHTFIEVRSPHQPEVGRLMVTEVDCYGVRRNRQPEFFLNGIVGHIRTDRPGWIDSWEQSTQLANTGVVTSISLKCTMSRTLGAITHKSLTMLLNQTEAKNHYRDQGWTTQIPSPPMPVQHRYQVRFTNWLRSFGTFSTMTGTPMRRSLRSLRIQAMT